MDWRGLDGCDLGGESGYGILGILNVTPDSFSDGGQCQDALTACIRAQQMYLDGASIIDIGAESTRPGAEAVSAVMEMERLRPVLSLLPSICPWAHVSVDTRNALTAQMALQHGAVVINDVSGLGHDERMLEVVASHKPGYVLMHAQGEPHTMQLSPHYDNVVDELLRFFEKGLNRLVRAGLPENRVAIDPGIGFGKTCAHNVEILGRLGDLLRFGRPLIIGVSRKSVLKRIRGTIPQSLDEVTAVASALLYSRGAKWHRVHNVPANRMALELAARLCGCLW